MGNPDRSISSSRGRGTCRRTRSTRHMVTPQGDQDVDHASGSQQQPPEEQAPLTQGDIPKIVELIVKQLPVPSNTTPATSQMPLASTSSQAPSTTLPGTVTSPLPISSFSPSISGIIETSYLHHTPTGRKHFGRGWQHCRRACTSPIDSPRCVTDSYSDNSVINTAWWNVCVQICVL